MDDDDDLLGENIWNAFTWRSQLSGKISLMQKHFEDLSFPESHQQMLDFFDTYFVAFLEEDTFNNEEGLPPAKLKNSNVPRVISDECFFVFLDDSDFTAIQELRLLELICSYFEGEELDPARYLVFDCLFGNIVDEETRFRDAKAKFLGKLVSMAVGTEQLLVLEFCAILLNKFRKKSNVLSLITNVVGDYCVLVPKAHHILENIVKVSPNFACQILEESPIVYSFHQKSKLDEKDDDEDSQDIHQELPPIPFLRVAGSWLSSNPKLFTGGRRHSLTSLPSIHTLQDGHKQAKKNSCPITGLLSWSVLSPLYAGVKIGGKIIDADEVQKASSLLHYGILNFFAMHRKSDSSASGDDDELEPGEVSEEKKPVELITESDIKSVISYLDETVEKLKEDITKEKLGESIDRLAQIIQVSKWSGCFLPSSKKFKHVLKKVPKTKLFSKVLKSL